MIRSKADLENPDPKPRVFLVIVEGILIGFLTDWLAQAADFSLSRHSFY